MELEFATAELLAIATDDRTARRVLGKDGANKLRRRLDDIEAAPNLSELYRLPGRFEALKGDRAGQYSLRLDGGRRLILEPAEEPRPERPDGSIDTNRVSRIRVIELENYHE